MTAVRMTVKKLVAILAVSAAACSGGSSTETSRSAGRATDAPNTGPTVDTGSALVQLKGDPLSIDARTRPPKGKKVDFSSSAVKSRRAVLSALRNDFKQWLRANAPAAKVTGEYDISLNAVAVRLNGVPLATIAGAPQVQRAELQGLYYPTDQRSADPDLSLVSADQVAATAGDGIRVAIVDTGIDITHPCFSDAGYPAQTQLGDKRFTNNKVIAAKVFNNKTPSRGFTAEAIQDHGTHVAGTVACNLDTAASVDGVTIPHPIAGVAPRALLGNYNVFPGTVDNARSEDILNALDAAYADGFDVANMSLGGNAHGIQDLLTIAVDDLDQANMVVAVAAGNSGPGHFTVESPGSAQRALTAGAASVGHLVAASVQAGGKDHAAATGDFDTVASNLTATLKAVTSGTSLGQACSALPAGSLAGDIALLARGTCTFSTKIRNAQDAGAVAVLVANNVAGDPVAMAADGTPNQPTAPAYMVSVTDGAALLALSGSSATITAAKQYLVTPNDDIMAGFSSQGPTDVDFRVKPDVVAPGVNVLSSIPHAFCAVPPCFAFFQGTSMATPHLAGSAAVVRWAHPLWEASDVRSAIVNTSDKGVLKNFRTGAPEGDPNVIGTGRLNVLSAVNASASLDPVSVSFGAVPSGSGQTRSATVEITNLGTGAATFAVSVGAGGGGVAFSVSPASVTLGAGESGAVTVTMSADKGAALGDHSATLSVGGVESEVAHAVVYTFVK